MMPPKMKTIECNVCGKIFTSFGTMITEHTNDRNKRCPGSDCPGTVISGEKEAEK